MQRVSYLLAATSLNGPMILIASAVPEILGSWEHALNGLTAVIAVRQFASLRQGLGSVKPSVLLLDLELPGLDGPRGVAALRRSNPATKIIIFSATSSDEIEIALFK